MKTVSYLDWSLNAREAQVSEATRNLIIVKAKSSELYEMLGNVIDEVEHQNESEEARKLKNLLLDFNGLLSHYIGENISENLLITDFKSI